MNYDGFPDYVEVCPNCGCGTDDGSCPNCGAASPHGQAEAKERCNSLNNENDDYDMESWRLEGRNV